MCQGHIDQEGWCKLGCQSPVLTTLSSASEPYLTCPPDSNPYPEAEDRLTCSRSGWHRACHLSSRSLSFKTSPLAHLYKGHSGDSCQPQFGSHP